METTPFTDPTAWAGRTTCRSFGRATRSWAPGSRAGGSSRAASSGGRPRCSARPCGAAAQPAWRVHTRQSILMRLITHEAYHARRDQPDVGAQRPGAHRPVAERRLARRGRARRLTPQGTAQPSRASSTHALAWRAAGVIERSPSRSIHHAARSRDRASSAIAGAPARNSALVQISAQAGSGVRDGHRGEARTTRLAGHRIDQVVDGPPVDRSPGTVPDGRGGDGAGRDSHGDQRSVGAAERVFDADSPAVGHRTSGRDEVAAQVEQEAGASVQLEEGATRRPACRQPLADPAEVHRRRDRHPGAR